jgi:hypothetical protein
MSLELSYEFLANEAEYNLNRVEELHQQHSRMKEMLSAIDVGSLRQEIEKFKSEIN